MHGLSIQKKELTLRRSFKISALVAGIVCLCLSLAAFAQDAGPTLDKLSLRQKVGQVFIWTYAGTTFSAANQSSLEKYQPGGLIAFGRNIRSAEQIAKLNYDLQKLATQKMKMPLFLMIDQEGGVVTRLHTSVPLPSALALGKMDDEKFVTEFGRANGELLHTVGFNVNLAPVLDISDPNKNSFIGNRAFGNDPEKVASLAVSYAEGISASGIMPTAKHFPGHGGIIQDSHKTVPTKLATLEELKDRDLIPFEEYADSDFPRAIMMAHLALPNIDPSGLPATYSSILINDYLREKLHYTGLVVTDDLEMSGASLDTDIGERAVRAFLAGNDMLMITGSAVHQKRAFEALLTAVKSGKILLAKLDESVARIINFKKELKIGATPLDLTGIKASTSKIEALSREVLKKNVQLALQNHDGKWPEIQTDTKALVLSSDRKFFESFKNSFRGQSAFFHLTPQSLDRALKDLSEFDLIIFYASGLQTAHWVRNLPGEVRSKTIVINVNNPGEVEAQNTLLSVLNINSYFPEAGSSVAELLSAPEARLPATAPSEAKEINEK